MVFSLKRHLCILLLATWLTGCIAPAATATTTPSPAPTPTPMPVNGAPGIGDSYYPDLGNGGYDVQNYILNLTIDPPANTLTGSAIIQATATEYLSSFDLDFHGLTVDSITVNGETVTSSRNADELIITPSKPLDVNKLFEVVVTYHGSPALMPSQPIPVSMGWSHADNGAINIWGEPDAASSWFPNNNHPRDKATYRFEITVPKPWMVAASGSLKDTKAYGDKTTFIWEMNKPMASYLASINIDNYELFTQSGPHGISIRDYYPADYSLAHRVQFNILPAAIAFFEKLFSPYPFAEYGVLIATKEGVCQESEMALEAQTLSIHCPSEFMATEGVIVHELAHMWFGDSVSLKNWQDIWLKEGFATYAEWLWASKNDPVAINQIAKNNRARFFDDPNFSVAKPAPQNLYTDESYTGGALVLQALRLEVGDETFFKILRTYAERYKYENAGTADFIAVAKEVSGKNLDSFFDNWLFNKEMPQLPN